VGEAQALLNKAEARAKSIEMIGKTLGKETGKNAGSLIIAEQYVKAFRELARNSNTIMLPSDVSNVPAMVTQVRLAIPASQRVYSSISWNQFKD
jgi:regulator of protease activity HflC (stomatin/prohibitin superfamily)